MLHRCKSRATKRDLAFDLTLDDIVIPSHCPALGIPLSLTGGGWDAPSVDRIDPAKGYIRGNIAIISTRANTIKNNATADEIMAVANWLREI